MRPLPILLIACATLPSLAGCASGGAREDASVARTRVGASPAPTIPAGWPERPIPYPVDVPAFPEHAVEVGTRTARGAPDRYWQQWADYDVSDVRLDTAARRLDGTTRIAYRNQSPDTLRLLVVQLIQNLHAPGAAPAR